MMGVESIQQLGAASTDPVRFGGKAAGLGRLVELGHRVPAGFALTVDALPEAIRHLGLDDEFQAVAASMRTGEPDLDRAGRIRDSLLQGSVPACLMAEVAVAAQALGDDTTLIVRSSAASEDSAAHSFAGIFESIPVSAENLADGIKTVWASVFTPRSLIYTAHAGLQRVPRMGVVVQRFIDAEHSGVMFTTFPRERGVEDTLVEHVPGTAEKLVRGEVTPSRLWLRSGVAAGSDLAESHARELARLAGVLEEQFGGPQDVEWCVIDSEVLLVQTRPVTATAAASETGDVAEELVLLRGTPASPGVDNGVVHLAFNIEQAMALESGSVLVTPMTNPDMVVSMRNSSAIVTDVGGMICHAAIVSRELQLPCVVGTGTATATLLCGDVVTVDGSRGVVMEGEVTTAKNVASRVSATDLWQLWPEDPGCDLIPLVSTSELLRTVPNRVRRVAYLLDGDLHCDTHGLWAPQASDGVRLQAVVENAAQSATDLDSLFVVTAGAVDSEVLADQIARLGTARIMPADGLKVAWAGETRHTAGPIAVPLVQFATARSGHRKELGPIDQSITRALDPSRGPGPVPQVRSASMPELASRQRWWKRLVEYGRFHREFATHDEDDTLRLWIEIRPEVLTSPLLKSLVQPGFEMVPRALGFSATQPMHTKWAKCRFHVRADSFSETWRQLVHGTWDQPFMEHFLCRVRQSYDQLAEIVRLFPASDEEAAALDDGQLVALATAWWPRWIEFFALCLFIQAQGEAILYPVIAETVEANLADLGQPPAGLAWPSLPDLIAPTTPVLSGEYMASVGNVRSHLDAAGLTTAAAALAAIQMREPPELADVVDLHLERWHWMRDRDLLFEPWDTAEQVVETALRTDPHPPVPYEDNLRQNQLALAFHSDLAEGVGRGALLRHGVRFLQDLNFERENHHVLWLEYSYPLRRIILEMERRLIDIGSALEPGMVFYLQMPELLDAVEALPAPVSSELCNLATARQRAYRHEAQLEPAKPGTLYNEDDYY